MLSAISLPARTCDSPTTSLARSTMKPRATPVSVTSSEPSHAELAHRCLTASTTRVVWCRPRVGSLPVATASRCAMPSTTPGTRLVDASCGVAFRTACDHATRVWPLASCRCLGGMLAAWTVVFAASADERTRPVCIVGRPSALRHRHVTTLGTRSGVVTTSSERASARLTALRAEMSTSSALRSLLKPSGAWPVSVSIEAWLASVRDCVIISLRMEAYSEPSAADQ